MSCNTAVRPQGPLKHQTEYFLKAHDVSYPNSDKNTNTNANRETNTNTETKKGRTRDTYDVIYILKGDDKRILDMIYAAGKKYKYKDKHKDKYKDK